MKHSERFPGAIAGVCLLAVAATVQAGDTDWPSFRGDRAAGFSPGAGPIRWDVETSSGIRWKKAIPGLGERDLHGDARGVRRDSLRPDHGARRRDRTFGAVRMPVSEPCRSRMSSGFASYL
jgi:hypothetical protein